MGTLNRGTIEIILGYACNCLCQNCWALSPSAPFVGFLTADDVREFLGYWETKNHVFGLVTLSGGEPSLNPQIIEICEVVEAYKAKHKSQAWCLTNYSVAEVRGVVAEIEKTGMHLGIADKSHGIPAYRPVTVHPKDIGKESESKIGCFQSSSCGLCHNFQCKPHGVFPCSPMGAAARVFGYQPCETLDEETLMNKLREHCLKCGLSLDLPKTMCKQVSPFWKEALDGYKKAHPRKT